MGFDQNRKSVGKKKVLTLPTSGPATRKLSPCSRNVAPTSIWLIPAALLAWAPSMASVKDRVPMVTKLSCFPTKLFRAMGVRKILLFLVQY